MCNITFTATGLPFVPGISHSLSISISLSLSIYLSLPISLSLHIYLALSPSLSLCFSSLSLAQTKAGRACTSTHTNPPPTRDWASDTIKRALSPS